VANLRNCIETAAAAGRITRAEATEIGAQLDDLEGQIILRNEYSPEAARTIAEQTVLDSRLRQVALDRRQAALQAVILHRAIQHVQGHERGMAAGIMSLLTKDPSRAGFSNIEYRGNAVLGALHGKFAKGLAALRTKNLGLSQDSELARDMMREIFGTNTGRTEAKQIANILEGTLDYARERFNAAGGDIPKLKRGIGYGIPQYHDPVRVGKVSSNEWIDTITPLLDRENIVNEAGLPMNDMELRILLDHAYDTIRTDGAVNLMPGQVGGRKLANRHREHRVLLFKDADSWLKYSDEFGHTDIYTTVTDHLNTMANEIARLEIMGPNPEQTFRYLRDLAVKKGELLKYKDRAMLDSVWSVVSGKANAVSSVSLADGASALRHYLVAAQLGGAFLSSLADLAFLRQTSRFNGLPAMKVYQRQLSLMNPNNAADREAAVRMGLTAQAWVNRALAANRFVEITGAGFSAKVADVTMRASLLSPWTDAGRKAFGMEFMGMIAVHTGRSFDELPTKLREGFTGYGITREDWDVLRMTELMDHDGAKFFSVENMMNRTDLEEGARTNLASKVQEMVLSETDFAVPMPDAKARAITTGAIKRGTGHGEFWRSAMLFKSFPITIMTTHLLRGARMSGLANKVSYLGQLTIATTVLGAVAMHAKDITRGKDPRSMDTPSFWTAAFIQGGGAGIFGDFIYAGIGGESRFGRGFGMTAAGPVAGFIEQFIHLTGTNLYSIMEGKDANIPADVVQFMRRYMPGGSLWYTRLAWERGVIDELAKLADPNAYNRFGYMVRKQLKDFDRDYWWRPGEAMPARLPAQ
jgi:hypothetical protein